MICILGKSVAREIHGVLSGQTTTFQLVYDATHGGGFAEYQGEIPLTPARSPSPTTIARPQTKTSNH